MYSFYAFERILFDTSFRKYILLSKLNLMGWKSKPTYLATNLYFRLNLSSKIKYMEVYNEVYQSKMLLTLKKQFRKV